MERRPRSSPCAPRSAARGSSCATLRPMIARRDAGGALPQARRALRRLSATLARLERARRVAAALGSPGPARPRARRRAGRGRGGAARLRARAHRPAPAASGPAIVRGQRMKRRAFLGSAAALGAGAAIDRVIGPGGGAPAAQAAGAPAVSHRADRLRGRPPGGHPHPARRRTRSSPPSTRSRRRGPSWPTALEALSERARRADARLRRPARRPGRGPDARLGHPRPAGHAGRAHRDDRLRRLAVRPPLRAGRAQAARA